MGLIVTPYIENLLVKARWRRQLNLNGYEGRLPVASDRLAEALRAELRDILDNGGKPFDILAAQHLYDFAIAAKDLLVVSAKTVVDVMKVVADVGGAMESLAGPNEAPPIEQQAETFGARMMREILAILPAITHKSGEDPRAIVAAIAEARDRDMPELAAALERKLLGIPGVTALPAPKITRAEVVEGSFEHGFADGCMQDKFARHVVNGACAVDEACRTPAYQAGYEAGCAKRASEAAVQTIAPPSKLDELMEKLEHVPDAVLPSAEISEETARALLEGGAS